MKSIKISPRLGKVYLGLFPLPVPSAGPAVQVTARAVRMLRWKAMAVFLLCSLLLSQVN